MNGAKTNWNFFIPNAAMKRAHIAFLIQFRIPSHENSQSGIQSSKSSNFNQTQGEKELYLMQSIFNPNLVLRY